MSNNINEILKNHDAIKFATTTGTQMHNRLAQIVIDDNCTRGDAELVERINSVPNLARLFSSASQTEVPIAGNIGTRFISRRIDRLYIDDDAQTVYVLDYKTDVSPEQFREHYVAQLHEYAVLLRQIYPKYKIQCLILWMHDWTLERV